MIYNVHWRGLVIDVILSAFIKMIMLKYGCISSEKIVKY